MVVTTFTKPVRLLGVSWAGTPQSVGCDSTLRVLRAAAPHYPTLRRFLSHLYAAIRSHRAIDSIDTALTNGDIKDLSRLCGFTNYQNIMFGHVDISSDIYECCPNPR